MHMQMADRIYSEMQTETTASSVNGRSVEMLFAVLIAGVLIFSGYYLFDPGTLPIRQVRIEGKFRNLSTTGLQDLVSNKVKGGFFNIDVSAVRNALLTEPWVRDVSVHRVWPDTLQVFVTEQVAVARWKEYGLLNRTGVMFVPDKSTFPNGLPLLDGPEGTQEMMMEKYFVLYKQLEPLAMHIKTLQLNERRAWSFETDNGLRVVLGRNNFDERLEKFIELMPASLGNKLSEVEMIDMRYPNGFAVRWKKADVEVKEKTGAL